MPTLGEELRRRREERGTTLADISEATRIGTRFLKAIETDNFSVLPGGIFTRSFIRAYAKAVGMNEDEAIARYQQQVSGTGVEAPAQTPAQQSQPQSQAQAPRKPVSASASIDRAHRPEPITYRQSPTRTNWPTIVIAAGILLFIGIIIYALVKQLNRTEPDPAQQAATQPAAQATASPQMSPQAGATPSADAPQASVNTGEQIRVRLESTTGDSSIRYWVDDAATGTTILLRPGESHDIPPAQNQVRLLIGNRVVLKLFINGREAAFPPDTKKFAAQVMISRDNLQSFFPPSSPQ